jgi:hypothetical protein
MDRFKWNRCHVWFAVISIACCVVVITEASAKSRDVKSVNKRSKRQGKASSHIQPVAVMERGADPLQLYEAHPLISIDRIRFSHLIKSIIAEHFKAAYNKANKVAVHLFLAYGCEAGYE